MSQTTSSPTPETISLESIRSDGTRSVTLSNGTRREVTMHPDIWDSAEFLRLMDGISERQLADYAAEELELNDTLTFSSAFRMVTVYLAARWK